MIGRRSIATGRGLPERLSPASASTPSAICGLSCARRSIAPGASSVSRHSLRCSSPPAVALATGRYLRRHLDVAAMLRCLGAASARTLRLFLVQFALVGLAAGVVGMLVAIAAQEVMVRLVAGADGALLPWPS